MNQENIETRVMDVTDEGEVTFRELSGQWTLVRITGEPALRRAGTLVNTIPTQHDIIAKLSDPNYLLLSLRDPANVDTIFLVVRLSDKWIEHLCLSESNDSFASLQAIAPVVQEYDWSKRYLWRDGYVIDTDGDVFSVNALPSVLMINGDLDISHQTEVRLPEFLLLRGELTLHNSTFKAVPHYLYAFHVTVVGCVLPMIAERLKTEGDVSVSLSKIDDLATGALIRGSLQLSNNPRLLHLPRAMCVGRNLEATSDVKLSFGDDTVVLGDLKIGPGQDGTEFGLDFIGRVLKTGDTIKIANSPEMVFEGTKLKLSGSAADGTFLGRHRDGGYSCSVIDTEHSTETITSPRREEILAVTKTRVSNTEAVAANQKARWVLH